MTMASSDLRDPWQASAVADAIPGAAERRQPAPPLAERIVTMPAKPTLSPVVLAGVVRLIEFALVVLVGVALHWFYLPDTVPRGWAYTITIPCMAALTVVAFQAVDAYHMAAFRSPLPQVLRIVGAWSMIFLMLLAAVFFSKRGETFSRVWLAGWFMLGLATIIVERLLLMVLVRALTRAGRLDRRTAIVGGGDSAESLVHALAAQRNTGMRICGIFDDRNEDRSPDVVAGFPKLGSVDDLVEFARSTQLDLVIFTLPISAESRILQMLRKLWVLPIDIRLAAHMSRLRLRPRSYSYIGAVPVLDVFDKPIADWDLVLKWLFDRIVGFLLLLALSPIFLVTAVAIKLDSKGPVFFRQKRYGFNNELVEVFKFRSMYVEQTDATAAKLVTKDDPRVTRVGRFIRKTSIDELPQLLNVVLKGDLSLVGPRPHAIHAKAENRFYEKVVDGYFARHKVKPGITGWAQINGWRGETDTEDKIQRRVEHDLYYIENWSLFLDVYILFRTPFSLLKSENAY
jgi:Undecaprenyl-phosphate glucose phosphotransferase